MRLIIFPTYLSFLRRRQDALAGNGVWDGRGCLVFQAFLDRLIAAARAESNMTQRVPDDAERELAVFRAVAEHSRQLRQLPLFAEMTERALRDVLTDLVRLFLTLGEDLNEVLACMRESGNARLNCLAVIYDCYEATLRQNGFATDAAVESAVLRLLRDQACSLPPILVDCQSGGEGDRGVVFTAVRWLTPFQQRLTEVLATRLGPALVTVQPTLPREFGTEDFLGRLAGLIEDEDSAFPGAQWVHNLADAVTMSDPSLLFGANANIEFSRSVGTYGEVEDLARRIRWEIAENGTQPHRIGLIVRDIGEYADAIADVFRRFRIPCFFRRGVPAAAVPIVKTVLGLAEFRGSGQRETFCALLASPWIALPHLGDRRPGYLLADDIRCSGARPVPDDGDQVGQRLAAYYLSMPEESRPPEPEAIAALAAQAWDTLRGSGNAASMTVAEHVHELRQAFTTASLDVSAAVHQQQYNATADGNVLAGLAKQAQDQNLAGWRFINDILTAFERPAGNADMTISRYDFARLLSDVVGSQTVHAGDRATHGVWVINPFDASGLSFDLVLLAGLNAGRFPARDLDSSLISDADRTWIHAHLPDLPLTALPSRRLVNQMENILFLTALATARGRLVLSMQAVDSEGRDAVPSVYFNTLWRMAGWGSPACGNDLQAQLSPYNRWRLSQPGSGYLQSHLEAQADETDLSKRLPLPGESFLSTIPATLCCSRDELLQRLCSPACSAEEQAAVRLALQGKKPPAADSDAAVRAARIVDGIRIDHCRELFTEQITMFRQGLAEHEARQRPPAADEFAGAAYSGVLQPGAWQRIADLPDVPDLSPTALETLARCPFRFLLEREFRIDFTQPVELEPDPRDRGKAVHTVMNHLFRLLRGDEELLGWADAHIPDFKVYRMLCIPWYAVQTNEGTAWELTADDRGAENRLRVVHWRDPEQYLEAYLHLAEAVAVAVWKENSENWNFGDSRLAALRRQELLRMIGNYMTNELTPSRRGSKVPPWAVPGVVTTPALFEFVFNDRQKSPAAQSLVLGRRAEHGVAQQLKLHGVIDRVDLIFDRESGVMSGLRVADYKGLSRARLSSATLGRQIARGLDCQLPVYGLAALQHLFPACRDAVEQWGPRTALQYYGYSVGMAKMQDLVRRNFVMLGDEVEISEPDGSTRSISMLDSFCDAVWKLWDALRQGFFATDPQACDYCPYASACRVQPRTLEVESAADSA